jgi:hypothetical protein
MVEGNFSSFKSERQLVQQLSFRLKIEFYLVCQTQILGSIRPSSAALPLDSVATNPAGARRLGALRHLASDNSMMIHWQ